MPLLISLSPLWGAWTMFMDCGWWPVDSSCNYFLVLHTSWLQLHTSCSLGLVLLHSIRRADWTWVAAPAATNQAAYKSQLGGNLSRCPLNPWLCLLPWFFLFLSLFSFLFLSSGQDGKKCFSVNLYFRDLVLYFCLSSPSCLSFCSFRFSSGLIF